MAAGYIALTRNLSTSSTMIATVTPTLIGFTMLRCTSCCARRAPASVFESTARSCQPQSHITAELGFLSPHCSHVTAAMRDIRVALLEADVALEVVRSFTDKVRVKAVGQEVVKSVTPGQMVVKVVHDELVEMLGSDASPSISPPSRRCPSCWLACRAR